LAWAWAKALAWAKAEAKSEELLFKISHIGGDAPRKLIVPVLKRVDAIERSDGKVIGQAREHQERNVVPGPLLEATDRGHKEA
jgi:hypothetical protein